MRGIRAVIARALCGIAASLAWAGFASAQAPAQIPAEARTVAAAYNRLGHSLFARLATSAGNIVMSPYSIGVSTSMVLAGARQETQREMTRVLTHQLPPDEVATANALLAGLLARYGASPPVASCSAGPRPTGQECPAAGPPVVKLSSANGLALGAQGGRVSDKYVALLAEAFSAEIMSSPTAAVINDWVGRKTEGRITKIIDEVDPRSAAILLNAVYFHARWLAAFRKSGTYAANFHLGPGSVARVETMHQRGDFSIAVQSGYRAIRLPYEAPQLAMIVIVPERIDGLPDVSRALNGESLQHLFTALSRTAKLDLDLSLPRFKTAFAADLSGVLQQLGMRTAFDAATADFSGITGRPRTQVPLSLGRVLHRAVIDVAEEGTEAAAATAVEMMIASAPPARPSFRVDSPFLFYVVDDDTGTILFQGRIADPRQRG